MVRFGVEEELFLLDAQTLVPIGIDDDARRALDARAAEADAGNILAEYLTCQVECVTAPLDTLAEARTRLGALRGIAGAHAEHEGAVAAASGTPFATTRSTVVRPAPHYDVVAAHLAHLTRGHEVNGLHVHVEVADEEERIRALNRLRGWAPVLLALTGDSPFADGVDTGFASWRSVIIRRLPTSWSPPHFHDVDDYRTQVDRLIAMEAVRDRASLSWTVRASDRFPTVEVRVFDAQLQVDDTLLAVALCRALATTDDLPASAAGVDAVDTALWTAARRGLDAHVIDPASHAVVPARGAVERLIAAVRPALDAHGDLAFVEEAVGRILREGTGADRQRAAHRAGGVEGLRALYAAGTASAPPASAPPASAPPASAPPAS